MTTSTTCASTYTTVTTAGTTFNLSATVGYDLSVICNPARLCANIETPTTLQASTTRPVRVTEGRGLLTS